MIRSNLTWIDEHIPELKEKILVTLSMEGCIPELTGDAREANVKGGLGIYFGDKLEGLKSIGMDRAFGCMPLYKKRLVQLIRNGRQHIEYKDVSYEDQPVEHVTDSREILCDLMYGVGMRKTPHRSGNTKSLYIASAAGELFSIFSIVPKFSIFSIRMTKRIMDADESIASCRKLFLPNVFMRFLKVKILFPTFCISMKVTLPMQRRY